MPSNTRDINQPIGMVTLMAVMKTGRIARGQIRPPSPSKTAKTPNSEAAPSRLCQKCSDAARALKITRQSKANCRSVREEFQSGLESSSSGSIIRLLGPPPANHDKEAAFTIAVTCGSNLAHHSAKTRAAIVSSEQILSVDQRSSQLGLGNGVDELDSALIHPRHDFADRVASLMRMAILVLEPGLAFSVRR